jgi:hypothetical protein
MCNLVLQNDRNDFSGSAIALSNRVVQNAEAT